MRKRKTKALIASLLVFAQLMSGVSVLASDSSDSAVAEISLSDEVSEDEEEVKAVKELEEKEETVDKSDETEEDSEIEDEEDEDSTDEVVDEDANSDDDTSESPAEDQESESEDVEEEEEVAEYIVTFMDSVEDSVIEKVTVEEYGTVEYPDAPEHDGYVFVEWDVELAEIIEDVTVTALYDEVEAEEEAEEEVEFPAFEATVGGITFTADDGVIPAGAEFKVTKVRDTADIEELIDEDIICIDSYDITLYDAEGEKIQPKGDVSLSFDVDEDDAENFKVFYTNGRSAEELDAELNSGSVTFETNHFSTYSVVGVSENGIMPLADDYHTVSWDIDFTIEGQTPHWRVNSYYNYDFLSPIIVEDNGTITPKLPTLRGTTPLFHYDTVQTTWQAESAGGYMGVTNPQYVYYYKNLIDNDAVDLHNELGGWGLVGYTDPGWITEDYDLEGVFSVDEGLELYNQYKDKILSNEDVNNMQITEDTTFNRFLYPIEFAYFYQINFITFSSKEKYEAYKRDKINNPADTAIGTRGLLYVRSGSESRSVNFSNMLSDYSYIDGDITKEEYEKGSYTIKAVNGNQVIDIFLVDKEYTVTFDAQGGTPEPDTQEVKKSGNGKAHEPTEPKKEGFAFKGWFTDNTSYNKKWNFTSDVVTGDMTLYAKWVEAFKVSFDANGGEDEPEDQMIEDGDKAEEPSKNPTKKGHRFGGWYKDEDCTEPWDFDEDVVEEDTELHAKWIVETYDVTFNAKGGSPTPTTQHVEYNNKATEPNTVPTRQGYNFKGWFTDDVTYAKKWQFDTDVVEDNMTLYARWTKINKITFDTDGGDPKPEDQEVETGEKVEEPNQDPTKKGHKFRGWYKDKEGTEPWDFDEDEVEDDTTIYAKWEVEVYKVTFNAMGGSPTPDVQDVEYNNLAQKPVTPSKTKSVLTGWYKEQQCENEWNFAADRVEEDITLYAGWDTVDYVVTFNANKGTPTPDPQGLYEGERATEPKNVKRDSVDSSCFKYNSASGKYYFDWNLWDTSSTVPTNSPLWGVVAKISYDLKGWTKEATYRDDGLYYNLDAVELYDFSKVVDDDMTLHAVWEQNGTYLFSYDVLIVDDNKNIIRQETLFSQLAKEGDVVNISVNLGEYSNRSRYSFVREYIGEPYDVGTERANWAKGKEAGYGGIYSVIYNGSDIKHCTVDLSEPFNQRNYCMYIMLKDNGITNNPGTTPDDGDDDDDDGDDPDPDPDDGGDPTPDPDPETDPTPLPTIIPLVIPKSEPEKKEDPTPSLITKLIPTPNEESAETDDDWVLHLSDVIEEDTGERLYTYVKTTQWGYVTSDHDLIRKLLVQILDYEPPVVYYREEDAIVREEEDIVF